MERIFGDVQQLIQHNPWLAIVASFIGGVMTASNPCVLAMVPLMISLVAGKKESLNLRKSFLFSLQFIIGLSVTFTVLGLISALMGRMFGDIGNFWKYLVAVVCLVMGVDLLGFLKLNFSVPRFFKLKNDGKIGALLMGLLFGVVSTPVLCLSLPFFWLL